MIYLLGGKNRPTSPSKLANRMDVSRVGALEKMKRLENLGYGKYIAKKGIILNEKSIEMIERDAKRHHLVEKFLQESLEIKQPEACEEATKIALKLSDNTIEKISSTIGCGPTCECGFKIGEEVKLEELHDCPWLKNKTSN